MNAYGTPMSLLLQSLEDKSMHPVADEKTGRWLDMYDQVAMAIAVSRKSAIYTQSIATWVSRNKLHKHTCI